MEFSIFIEKIFTSFSSTFNLLKNIIEIIFKNNFIKLIVYMVILYFVIEILGNLLSLIKNVFSMKKAEGKNKVNSNTDIE